MQTAQFALRVAKKRNAPMHKLPHSDYENHLQIVKLKTASSRAKSSKFCRNINTLLSQYLIIYYFK